MPTPAGFTRIVVSKGATSSCNATAIQSPSSYAGSGAAAEVQTGGTLNLNGTTLYGNSASGDGGAIYNLGNVNASNGASFSNNSATYGGAIENFGSTSIAGTSDNHVSFFLNQATSAGGAILHGGTTGDAQTIVYADFSKNQAGSGGGAIYATDETDELVLSNVAFTSNGTQSNAGGAIQNAGTMSLTSADFSGNYAVSGNAGAIYNGGSMTLSGVNFSGNRVNNSGTTGGSGGAIFNGGSVTITSAVFTGNSASLKGGAIYVVKTGNTTITDATFSGNSAGSGGAIFASRGTINLSGTNVFSDNSASSGGAIFASAGTLINLCGETTLATSNDTIVNAGTINWDLTGATAGKLNGYQYLTNSGTLTITVAAEQTVGNYVIATGNFDSIDDKKNFTIKTSDDAGTAVTIDGNPVKYGDMKYKLAVSGTDLVLSAFIYDERIVVTSDNSPYALYSNYSYTMSSYEGNGGAVFINSDCILSGTGVTFSGNSATSGGAIYNSAGTVTLSDASFVSNSATSQGGAIYNNNGTVTLSGDASFVGNSALNGTIYNSSGTVEFAGSSATFSGNLAKYCGAIYNIGGTVTLSGDASFTGNSAGSSGGGAINNVRGTVTVSGDATFSGNSAMRGAIYNTSKGTVAISGDASFVGNTASSGGAVFNFFSGTSATFANATFIGNSGVSGGAIFNASNGTIEFTGSSATFSGNSASRGGAIYNLSGMPTISGDAFFVSNVATSLGGAIFTTVSAFTFAGSSATFIGNSAGQGGAIYNSNKGSLTFNDVAFSNNAATSFFGGAIYNLYNGTVTVSGDASFVSNTAATNGGAICTSTGTVTISGDASFVGNSAAALGGAIYVSTGTLTLANATFNGNNATSGGAIYNDRGTINLKNAVTLSTSSDTWVNIGRYVSTTKYYATVNWDLTGGLTQYGSINNFQYYSNEVTEVQGVDELLVKQTITVSATQETGSYTIATGNFDDVANKNTFTIKTADDETGATITINGDTVEYSNRKYTLATSDTNLVLTVAEPLDDRIIVTSENSPYVLSSSHSYTMAPYTGDGGAVFINSGCILSGSNEGSSVIAFSGNSATGNGGAIFNSKGIVSLSGSTVFVSNAAGLQGGALFNTGSTVNVSGTTVFSTNAATTNGGAFYNEAGAEANFSGSTTFVSNATTNEASTYGGAIYNISATVNLSGDNTFTSNASVNGGAIYNHSAVITLSGNNTFSGNVARRGGAIKNQGGTVNLSGTTLFSDNSAPIISAGEPKGSGGAIYNSGNGTVNFYGSTTFTGNTATVTGGAIYNDSGSIINFANEVTLTTSNDTIVNSGTVNWDVSGATTGKLVGMDYLTNSGTLTITVAAEQTTGDYTIATGVTTTAGKETFTLKTADDATGKSITVGGDAVAYSDRTYSLAVSGGNLVLNVSSVAAIEYTLGDDVNVTYDGAAHSISLTVTAPASGYTVSYSLNGGTDWTVGEYTLTDVGTATVCYKIEASGYTTVITDSRTLTVTAKELTVMGTTAANKIYDGNTTATVTAGTLSGVVGSDEVTLDATGAFIDKNAGTGKTVNVNYSLSGAKAGNYVLASAADTTTADVTAKELSVIGTAADGKVYDGTTDAVIGIKGTLSGVIGEDVVTIDSATGTFADKNAGNGKAVTVEYTLSGADATNYTVADGATIADIDKRAITLKSGDDTKTWDGTPLTNENVAVTSGSYVTGETFEYSNFASQTAVGSTSNTFDYSDGTASKSNYEVTQEYGTLTVTPAGIVYNVDGAGSFTYDGMVHAVTLTVTTPATGSTVYYSIDGKTTWTAGNSYSLTDAGTAEVYFKVKADGYSDVITDAYTLTVNKRSVTLTSNDATKTYDGTALTDSTVTVGGDGFVAGEATASAAGTITNAGSATNTIVINEGTGYKADNYSITKTEGTLTVNKRAITLRSGDDTKTWDGTPLTNENVAVTSGSYVDGETFEYSNFASQTAVGSTSNTFDYADDTASKNNYDVTQEYGTLTVTPAGIVYNVDGAGSFTYDGTAHAVTLTVTTPATGSTVQYSIDGKATWQSGNSYSLTDAGTADVYFKVTAEGYADVITDAYTLTVNQRNVTLKSNSATKTYDGKALIGTVTVGGDGFVAGEATAIASSILNAGSIKNTITINEGTGYKASNYSITKTEGTLKVNKRKVTLTSGSAEKIWDGKALTCKTVTVSGSGWATGEGATYNVTGSQTKVGSSANNYTYKLKSGTNASNYTITKKTGTLTVTEKYAVITDFNDSGRSDVPIFNEKTRKFTVLEDQTNGKFKSVQIDTTVTKGWTYLGTGYINSDGVCDVVWQYKDGTVGAWIVNGTKKTHVTIAGAKSDWHYVGIADVNGDGRDNIVWLNDSGLVLAWNSKSNGTYKSDIKLGTATKDYTIVGLGDFDGDGKSDVLLRNTKTTAVGYWSSRNKNKWTNICKVSSSYNIAGVGDFDCNGVDDILWQNTSNNKVGCISNKGSWSTFGTGISGYKIQGTGDYNGDGVNDVLWCSGSSYKAWTIDGKKITGTMTIA